MAVLPLHRATSRHGSRQLREKIILLFIFALFAVVCFGAFFFVPDFRDKLSTNPSVPNPVQKFVNEHVQQVAAPNRNDPVQIHGGADSSSVSPSLRTKLEPRADEPDKHEVKETQPPVPETTPAVQTTKPVETEAPKSTTLKPDPETLQRRDFIVKVGSKE